jgi:hypothetical protein
MPQSFILRTLVILASHSPMNSDAHHMEFDNRRLGNIDQDVIAGAVKRSQPNSRVEQEAAIVLRSALHYFSVCELDPNPQVSCGHVREELYLVVIESSFMPLHKEDRLRLRYLDKRAFVLVIAPDV